MNTKLSNAKGIISNFNAANNLTLLYIFLVIMLYFQKLLVLSTKCVLG